MKDTYKTALVVLFWVVFILVAGATAEWRRQMTMGTPDAILPVEAAEGS